jgi:penicillin-binding protein 2
MFLLAGIQIAAGFSLVGRLYYLQFVKSEEYRTLAEGNRIKIQLIAPARGDILDRAGQPLAENEVNYRLFIEREHRKQAQESFARLTSLVTLTSTQQSEVELALQNRFNRKPMLVKEHLSWPEVTRVEYNIHELPSAYIEQGQVRYYPLGEKAAHLIGYVGRVSEAEMQKEGMEKDSPLYRLPEFKIGKNGIELRFEEQLRGKAGARHLEVNVSGLQVRELKMQPSIKGETLNLAIDLELQNFAANRMGVESGAIVVMDVRTGEILTLVSMPAFDPNSFSKGITTNYWKELNANEKNPLLNKALSGLFPPGSTFKMLVGLAALKTGTTNEHRTVYCPGHFYLGRHRFHCWKPGGHGAVNMVDALAESCDTYFYTMGNDMGIEPIASMCHQFGLGQKSGIGLLGEKEGIIPSPEWKRRTYNVPWVKGDTVNASIGQGYVLASPIQMALMITRMANGGRLVNPSLMQVQPGNMNVGLAEVDPSHLALVMRGMDAVINATNGTAHGARIISEDHSFGGKTGTSQVRRITIRGQDQSKVPWRYRHHAWFVGYAPVEEPRFAASILIEHGGGGASAAAPVARDVLWKVQQLAAEHPERYRR